MLEEKLKQLPGKPGVYLMLDKDDNIIYVGKAASLKNRVRSYFRGGQQSAKVKALVEHVEDIDYIITDSEVEALILECNLIKEHRPKYNSMLKDDKTYPYLKVTLNEAFPRIEVTRRVKKDGAKYFGPYTRAGAMHETLKLVRRLFLIRTCRNLERQERPCLNHHIKRCLAPCSGKVSQEQYLEGINGALMFLSGKQEKLVEQLEEKMHAAAENLEFEKAAELRDQLKSVKQVLAKQKIVSSTKEDQDVIAMARGLDEACVQVFFVRGGKVIGREHFFMNKTDSMSRSEIITAFIKQYYSTVQDLPKKLIVEEPIEDKEVIEKWLSQRRGNKVSIHVPQKGEKLKLVQMVAKNALMLLKEEELARRKKTMAEEEAVLELQKELQLPKPPYRIECYDISNTGGSNSVGSMVVFENGRPKNSDYRRFKIKTVEGPNDFASMQEVLYRRFKNYQQEQEEGNDSGKFSVLPDMVLIDGGKGQLGAAVEVMKTMGVSAIPVFGLAKKEELLFRQGEPEPIRLSRDSEALHLVQRLRDEAHRFAITYHRNLRKKAFTTSVLDEIPGIGPKRKKALLKHFGSVKKIKEATLEEIASVESMDRKSAEKVYEHLCR